LLPEHSKLSAIEFYDNSQAVLSTAEVMTIALAAVEWFGSCFEDARKYMIELRISRLCRGLSQQNQQQRSLFLWPAYPSGCNG